MSLSTRRRFLLVGSFAVALFGAAVLFLRITPGPPLAGEAAHPVDAPKEKSAPQDAGSAPNASKPNAKSGGSALQAQVRPEERTAAKVAEVIGDYQHLVAEAKAGNTDAQLKLFSALHTCSQAALTQAGLDDRIKDLETRVPRSAPNHDMNVRMLTSEYQQCSQFSRPQIDDWRKWLSMAAATGDPQARSFYISFGRPDDPKSDTYLQDTRDYNANAQKYLADGVSAGDPMALLETSGTYAADPMGGGIGVDPDPIKQYAYLYAYCLATECKNASLMGLQKLAAGLSPQDLSNATSQGQAIYKKCCAK